MNSPIFTRDNKSIRESLKIIAIVAVLFSATKAIASWKIDFSRRESQMQQYVTDSPMNLMTTQTQVVPKHNVFAGVVNMSEPVQDVVILNTAKGFIPSTIRLRNGEQYKIYVVNVNKKQRNASFIMDAFDEHDSTFYGKVRSFYVSPKRDGVYSYESPESAAQGQAIVYSTAPTPSVSPVLNVRAPASE